MSQLTAGNIAGKSIPNEGDQIIDGQDVIAVNVASVKSFAQKLFYGAKKAHPTGSATSGSTSASSAPTTGSTTSGGSDPAKSGCIY